MGDGPRGGACAAGAALPAGRAAPPRPVARQNGWQLAEAAGEATPYGMQRLLVGAGWEADLVRDDLRAYVAARLGDPAAVLIVDETGFLKQGTESAGVARQGSGPAGRRENQRVGVFLAHAAPRGCACLDRARYRPEERVADRARCVAAGSPEATPLATKGELARALLARAFAAGVPAARVVGDTAYGHAALRRRLEGQGRAHVLAVASDHGVWTAGAPVAAATLVAALPPDARARLSAGDGSQGPRRYAWACLARPYEAAAGWAHRLPVRRRLGAPDERADSRVYAPAGTPPGAMAAAAGARWQVERALAEAKDLVGLDQYAVRRWEGRHRHATRCALAHAALVVARARAAAEAAERGGARCPAP